MLYAIQCPNCHSTDLELNERYLKDTGFEKFNCNMCEIVFSQESATSQLIEEETVVDIYCEWKTCKHNALNEMWVEDRDILPTKGLCLCNTNIILEHRDNDREDLEDQELMNILECQNYEGSI